MDLGEIADALYALPLGEFTAARADYVKAVKAEGDRALATAVGKLRRPTASAWLVNQLAREQPDELARLADLGERLRAAHHDLDGAAIRELSRNRQVVTGALLAAGREVGRREGQPVSDAVVRELEDMFTAALAGAEAAAALAGGRLTSAKDLVGIDSGWPASGVSTTLRPLPARAGTGAPDLVTEEAGNDTGAGSGLARVSDLAVARLAKARAELERLDVALEEAETAAEDAQHDADTATDAETAARRAVTRLRAELAEAERTEKEAREQARTARRDHEDAERALREVRKRREVAANRLAGLTDEA